MADKGECANAEAQFCCGPDHAEGDMEKNSHTLLRSSCFHLGPSLWPQLSTSEGENEERWSPCWL